MPMRRYGILLLVCIAISFSLFTPALAQDGEQELPTSHRLDIEQLHHIYQSWNNCGPATMTMGLSYYGGNNDQSPAATFMKPHTEDKNVNPWEMVAYVNESAANTLNVQSLYRPAGTQELLKTLLYNDFPVIIEKGYEPEGYEWMGHYLLLIGYDDNEGVFLTYDSFSGHGNFQGLHETYEYVAHYWSHFGNMFLVVYPPEREQELMLLLGDLADMDRAYEIQAERWREAARQDPDNGWNWFNIGDALTHLGNYELATEFFRRAFERDLPWRTLWYRHTPLEAFYQSGDLETTLQLAQNTKLTTPYIEEMHYYHGLVLASQGRDADARAQFRQALQYNRNFAPASEAIEALDNGTFEPVNTSE